MTTVRETKRGNQIAAIHGLADWLADHPAIPMPTLSLHRHLHSGDGTDVENLASVRSLAEQIGIGTDESLDDRTVLRYQVNEHVWYELYAWHKDGRGNLAELERLRARVAELEARRPAEPVVQLTAAGLTPAADASRGPLAGTTPVVTYFSFGHGQTDPASGQSLLDHYVTVVAPTYDACREAMFASRFGKAWSFDYLAGRPRTTEWVRRWTEHEAIVAPGTDPVLAESALKAAAEVLSVEKEPF